MVKWLCSYVVICYSSLRRPSRFNAIKAAVGDRCHIEKAKGNDIQNKEYCSKRGNLPNGEPLWGRDVEAISSKLYNLCRAERLQWSGSPECPVQVIKYYKGIEAYIRLTRPIPERDFKTEVRFYYGRPGSGKSRKEERSQRLKLLEDEYTTSLAEIGGMDTNSMSASSSMTFMDG